MGRHLDELKELDKLVNEYTKENRKLLKIASRKDAKGNTNVELAIFLYNFALLTYQLSLYLIAKYPSAIDRDKIDRNFKDIMKHFNNGENNE